MALLFAKEDLNLVKCKECNHTELIKREITQLLNGKHNTYQSINKRIEYVCKQCGAVVVTIDDDGHSYIK